MTGVGRDGERRNRGDVTGEQSVTESNSLLHGNQSDVLRSENLSEKRKEKGSTYVSKAITGNCLENIAGKFKLSNSERYDLRSSNIFFRLPKPNSNYIYLVNEMPKECSIPYR